MYNSTATNADGGKAISIGINGDIIVAGNTTDSITGLDFVLLKYNTEGDLLWVRQYDGSLGGKDSLIDMTTDINGNIYLTGKSQNSVGFFDVLTIKYDLNGSLQWANTYNGTAGTNDEAVSIIVDDLENAYILANTSNNITLQDISLIKYNTIGNEIWVHNFDGSNLNDYASDITFNSTSDIIVAGYITNDTNSTSQDIVVLKLNSNGGQQWAEIYNGLGNGNDIVNAVTCDNANNIFITGSSFQDTIVGSDLITIKYNQSGTLIWASTYDGLASEDDSGNDIEVDQNGNAYVCGSNFTVPFMGHDFVTLKYDQNGDTLWVKRYNGPGGSNDIALDLVLDDSSNVYVTGYNFTLVAHDYATLKYNEFGDREWLFRFNGPDGADDGANAIAIDDDGNIYVTGITHSAFTLNEPGLGNYSDIATIKYSVVDLYSPPDYNNEGALSSFLFYENKGQLVKTNGSTANDVLYYTTTSYPALYFQKKTLSYVFSRVDTIAATIDTLHRIDMEFENSNPSAAVIPIDKGQGILNYYLEHCPTGITDIVGYQRLFIPSIYENIDLHYYSNANGIKYYFDVLPFGHSSDIQIRFNGADSISVESNGRLIIYSSIGKLELSKPISYQYDSLNNIFPVSWPTIWTQIDSNSVAILTGAYERDIPLVIQIDRGPALLVPTPPGNLEWSTYFGGGSEGYLLDVNNDISGNIYTTGYSLSSDYPVINASQGCNMGSADIVISKFEPYGIRHWSTYFGGNGADIGSGIIADQNGNVFVTGVTSLNANMTYTDNTFPVIPVNGAYNQDPILGPDYAILIKLDQIYGVGKWATAFGDDNVDARALARTIDIDNKGAIYIAGYGIKIGNFPIIAPSSTVCNPFLQGTNNISMGFIAKFSGTSNSLDYSTLFGNDGCDIYDIEISSTNDLFLTGRTSSTNTGLFPTANANNAYYTQTYGGGNYDAFIAKFNDCHEILWSTFFGGIDEDFGNGIVYTAGRVFIVGKTHSDENTFPLRNNNIINSLNRNILDGTSDGFIASFSANTSAPPALKKMPDWCTYFGGNSIDECWKICCNTHNNLFITGNTQSIYIDNASIILTGVYQQDVLENASTGVHADAFILSFDANLNFLWSTYFGGEAFASAGFVSRDNGYGISAFSSDKLYLVGEARSYEYFPLFDSRPTYPTAYFQGSVNTTNGYSDGFISQFSLSNTQLSIDENNTHNMLDVYPNPNIGYFTISFNNIEGRIEKLNIYNEIGMIVYTESIDMSNEKSIDIHVDNLVNGLYFVTIITDASSYTTKIVIYR